MIFKQRIIIVTFLSLFTFMSNLMAIEQYFMTNNKIIGSDGATDPTIFENFGFSLNAVNVTASHLAVQPYFFSYDTQGNKLPQTEMQRKQDLERIVKYVEDSETPTSSLLTLGGLADNYFSSGTFPTSGTVYYIVDIEHVLDTRHMNEYVANEALLTLDVSSTQPTFPPGDPLRGITLERVANAFKDRIDSFKASMLLYNQDAKLCLYSWPHLPQFTTSPTEIENRISGLKTLASDHGILENVDCLLANVYNRYGATDPSYNNIPLTTTNSIAAAVEISDASPINKPTVGLLLTAVIYNNNPASSAHGQEVVDPNLIKQQISIAKEHNVMSVFWTPPESKSNFVLNRVFSNNQVTNVPWLEYVFRECDQPSYTASEHGYFIWKNCQNNSWHVRVTGGGISGSGSTYMGVFKSDQPIVNSDITKYSFETGSIDSVIHNTDGSISYTMQVWHNGQDGIDIDELKTNLCFMPDDNTFDIYLGQDKYQITTPINLDTIQACDSAPPPPTDTLTLLKAIYYQSSSKGIWIKAESDAPTGTANIEATMMVNGVEKLVGVIGWKPAKNAYQQWFDNISPTAPDTVTLTSDLGGVATGVVEVQ